MDISREVATAKGPAETFTGEVWMDPITQGLPPSQLNVAAVHFTPGARSARHSHEGGQTLYVTEGRGLVQVRGQEIVELNPGDVIFAPDGEEHWHTPGLITSGPTSPSQGALPTGERRVPCTSGMDAGRRRDNPASAVT